jgi:TRAP transporter TAXI family solute receptor
MPDAKCLMPHVPAKPLRHFALGIVHCAATAALVACSSPQAAPSPPRPLRIVSAFPGGSPFNRTLAGVYDAELPDTAPEVVKSAGVVESLELLQRGDAEVAYSFTNVVYAGSAGQLPGQAAPFQRLRAIALLQPALLHVLVGPSSTVRNMDDLRDRPLKLWGPGAALVMTVESMLPAFELDAGQLQSAGIAGPEALTAQLLDGRLDALAVLGPPPVKPVDTAIAGGARLLPVKGRKVQRLLREYPFYRAVVIPADTYPGLEGPLVTVGVNGVLVCRADLPDDLVYRLTKALYSEPTGVQPALAQWLEPAAGAATPIPLHPGAARYYRERELAP